MIAYFDTSALIPLVIDETTSDRATRLWEMADHVVSSRLIYAEARAALGMAQRLGRIDRAGLRDGVEALELLMDDLSCVEVTAGLVRDAGSLADSEALRGYDAIHLASARLVDDGDLVMVAGDGELIHAARHVGVATAALFDLD